MQISHPQRRELVYSWQLYIQQHAAIFAPIRFAILMIIAVLGVLLFRRRAPWMENSASTNSWLGKQPGDPALTCTGSLDPSRRLCLARRACHSAAATTAVRRRTGSTTARSLNIPCADSASVHTVMAPGGGNMIEFVGIEACNSSSCKGAPALLHQELPTIFSTGSMLTEQQPRLLFIFQLQQLFAALKHLRLEERSFRVVVVDDVDIDKSVLLPYPAHVLANRSIGLHPAVEAVSGGRPVLLSSLPCCFQVAPAVVLSTAFLPMLPTEAPISSKEASAVQPAFHAFAAWLLTRFGVEHSLAVATSVSSSNKDGIKSVSREPQGDGAATGERHVVEGKVAAVLTVAVRFTINCMLGVSILADPSNERLVQRLLSLPDLQGLLQGFAKPHPYQVQGLAETQALVSAGTEHGFAVQAVDMRALSFGQQLQVHLDTTDECSTMRQQVVANSSVYICAHSDSAALLLALPPEAVVVQLMHHHYGRYQDHAVANLAVVMQREVVVWHDHSQNCGSGKARATSMPQAGGCVDNAILVGKHDAALMMKAVLNLLAETSPQHHGNLLLILNAAVST